MRFIKHYYNSDGSPIACPYCSGNETYDKINSIDGGIASEIEYFCSHCHKTIAYWAYGSFDPGYKKEFDCTIWHAKRRLSTIDNNIWKLKAYQNFILWLFKPRFSVINPIWLFSGFLIYIYNVFYRLNLKIFKKQEVTRYCDNCKKEIGTSLWGYCSHQCLKKLTKSPEELYEEKNNRNESR